MSDVKNVDDFRNQNLPKELVNSNPNNSQGYWLFLQEELNEQYVLWKKYVSNKINLVPKIPIGDFIEQLLVIRASDTIQNMDRPKITIKQPLVNKGDVDVERIRNA